MQLSHHYFVPGVPLRRIRWRTQVNLSLIDGASGDWQHFLPGLAGMHSVSSFFFFPFSLRIHPSLFCISHGFSFHTLLCFEITESRIACDHGSDRRSHILTLTFVLCPIILRFRLAFRYHFGFFLTICYSLSLALAFHAPTHTFTRPPLWFGRHTFCESTLSSTPCHWLFAASKFSLASLPSFPLLEQLRSIRQYEREVKEKRKEENETREDVCMSAKVGKSIWERNVVLG